MCVCVCVCVCVLRFFHIVCCFLLVYSQSLTVIPPSLSLLFAFVSCFLRHAYVLVWGEQWRDVVWHHQPAGHDHLCDWLFHWGRHRRTDIDHVHLLWDCTGRECLVAKPNCCSYLMSTCVLTSILCFYALCVYIHMCTFEFCKFPANYSVALYVVP